VSNSERRKTKAETRPIVSKTRRTQRRPIEARLQGIERLEHIGVGLPGVAASSGARYVPQQRPGGASHFVGECDRHDFEWAPRQELRQPGVLLWVLLGAPQHSMRPNDEDASDIGRPAWR
jgi:hypothetical protein